MRYASIVCENRGCSDCGAILQGFDDLQRSGIALTAEQFCKSLMTCGDVIALAAERHEFDRNEIQKNRSLEFNSLSGCRAARID